jgi:hypothetical protein
VPSIRQVGAWGLRAFSCSIIWYSIQILSKQVGSLNELNDGEFNKQRHVGNEPIENGQLTN